MQWTPEQEGALKAVRDWMRDPLGPQVFRLFGPAGTGKSSLAKTLAQDYNSRFAAFTAKASLVLRKNGCHGAQTIHSLIYIFKEVKGGQPQFVLNPNSVLKDIDLLIVDEVSMVNGEMAKDLLSFGTRILVLGDPFQLPPVKGTGFFIEKEPDYLLTEIHRQALDNPIIYLSMIVREGGTLDYGDYETVKIIHASELSIQDVTNADIIITGKNETRRGFNDKVRKTRGFTSPSPQINDKVICLKNDKEKFLVNGQIYDVLQTTNMNNQKIKMHVASEDDPTQDMLVNTHPAFYTNAIDDWDWKAKSPYDEFDFGYAITCHKSQGSQWDNILLIDQSMVFRNHSHKWLYTAITRAAETITIVM